MPWFPLAQTWHPVQVLALVTVPPGVVRRDVLLQLEPELEPELAPEPELELASVTRAQLQHEPEPEREVSGVAALLARLGLAEYLPVCLQHEMDLGAPC